MSEDTMMTPAGVDAAVQAGLLDTFRTVAATMPWYRTLLAEQGVTADDIRDAADFSRHCPLLTKRNTFDRFTLAELAATTALPQLASVLTSSGHGGRFSFGLNTREQEQAGADAIDFALDDAFDVAARPTLALNCLPMGVTFGSRCMTVATTSVREDMAVALVEAFGDAYQQVLIVADPLFLKRLIDYARGRGLDWRRHRLQVVVGEEVFGEHFRGYMAQRLGLDLTAPDGSWLMSSFGVGELGLHLCYETRATVALRRLVRADPTLASALDCPASAGNGLPMLFTYEPRRIHLEIESPAADGYGRLTVSMLDTRLPIPLLRYQTGDIARLLDPEAVAAPLHDRRLTLPAALPAPPDCAARPRARGAAQRRTCHDVQGRRLCRPRRRRPADRSRAADVRRRRAAPCTCSWSQASATTGPSPPRCAITCQPRRGRSASRSGRTNSSRSA